MNHIRLVGFNPYTHDTSQPEHSSHKNNTSASNPCTDTLTDKEYLLHMIPHHQVAIDMSVEMEKHTTNPELLTLCRRIIQIQSYEIWEMNMILSNISDTIMDSMPGHIDTTPTKLERLAKDMSKPDTSQCILEFFDPDEHKKHEMGEITRESFLRHMLPHHQVAIDMSKRLLLHTNHSYLLDFSKNLIIHQQGEIYYMKNILQNSYNYDSILLKE